MYSKVVLAAAIMASANAFAPVNKASTSTSLNAISSVFFGSINGTTEYCAKKIADAIGCQWQNIDEAQNDEIAKADCLILGAPTWNTGADDNRSGTEMDSWLYDNLPEIDMRGKPVAIFGVGDQNGYGEHFCDAAGELYDQLELAGATLIFGKTRQDGYEHSASKAIRDDMFVGLMLDEDNQSEESEERVKDWIAQLKDEGFPL